MKIKNAETRHKLGRKSVGDDSMWLILFGASLLVLLGAAAGFTVPQAADAYDKPPIDYIILDRINWPDFGARQPEFQKFGATTDSPNSPALEVKKILADHSSLLAACFENDIRRNPYFKAAVDIEFVITPGGEAKNLAVSSADFDDVATGNCLIDRLAAAKYPQNPDGAVGVFAEFSFRP